MRVIDVNGLPVIEGTSVELVKLAVATTGAIREREAVVLHNGRPLIGVRLVVLREYGDDMEVTPDGR